MAGSFSSEIQYPAGQSPASVETADVDGDTDIDIVVGLTYNIKYSERFDYLYSDNNLVLQSSDNIYRERYYLRKRSVTPKTF